MIEAMTIELQRHYANGQRHPSWTAVQTFAYAMRQAEASDKVRVSRRWSV